MQWRRLGFFMAICAGATGCATTAHPDASKQARAVAWTKPAVAPPRQVSLPPEQGYSFVATKADEPEKYRLAHYFPGFGRPTPTPAPVKAVPVQADAAPAPTVVATKPAATTARPSWFAFRKPKLPVQTYMTDVRPVGGRKGLDPTVFPVALQLPGGRIADKAVVPTSVDLPAADKPAVGATPEPAAAPEAAVPTNPDSSQAAADPLSPTEAQLAVKPLDSLASDAPAQSVAEVSPPPADEAPDEPSSKPEPKATTETPLVDPRERPRMAANPPAPAATTGADEPKSIGDEPMMRSSPPPPTPAPAQPAPDARAIKAAPSAADPDNSLGLPAATMPASYTQHNSIAVRGSYQAPPGPVLASPQVGPSPQSAAQPTAAKTWKRPCLRRLIRRMCKLGEYANPPTAQPH